MKVFKVLICLMIVNLLCCSCVFFKNPLRAFEHQNVKVESLVGQVNTNNTEINSDLSGFVFSADATLRQNPSPDKYNLVARDFTTSALKVTGTPTPSEQVVYENTISNLLSANQKLVEKGEKQVEQENRDVAGLLNQRDYLSSKLQEANVKLEKISSSNSKLAQTFEDLKKCFWIIVIGIGAIIIIRIVSEVMPEPYNNLIYIVSVPLSALVKLVEIISPYAIEGAGFVGKEFKLGLTDIVTAIESFKKSNPEAHPALSATISATVDSSNVAAVNAAKSAAGITS